MMRNLRVLQQIDGIPGVLRPCSSTRATVPALAVSPETSETRRSIGCFSRMLRRGCTAVPAPEAARSRMNLNRGHHDRVVHPSSGSDYAFHYPRRGAGDEAGKTERGSGLAEDEPSIEPAEEPIHQSVLQSISAEFFSIRPPSINPLKRFCVVECRVRRLLPDLMKRPCEGRVKSASRPRDNIEPHATRWTGTKSSEKSRHQKARRVPQATERIRRASAWM